MTKSGFLVKIDRMSYLDLPKPIIALAPMHGFTNSEFRLKCRQFGADLVYSEMVAAEGIIRRVPAVLAQLEFVKEERPVALSKVMPVCTACKKPCRIQAKVLDTGKKVRVCHRCKETF